MAPPLVAARGDGHFQKEKVSKAAGSLKPERLYGGWPLRHNDPGIVLNGRAEVIPRAPCYLNSRVSRTFYAVFDLHDRAGGFQRVHIFFLQAQTDSTRISACPPALEFIGVVECVSKNRAGVRGIIAEPS
jgi:hypothetical protein